MGDKNIKKNIKLTCFFCFSNLFILPSDDYTPFHGSFVVCANCGRENDFTSLIYVAERKAQKIAEEYVQETMKSFSKNLKNMFKNNKYIKIK